MDDPLEVNREYWDELAELHVRSETYDVAGFKAGRNSLHDFERLAVGDVQGKRLLHLQCHFGLDTLSWARLGARVTGVDFSGKAIELARSLAGECGIEATFVCCDLDDLPGKLSGQFDVVFTSGGVLSWLPDLKRWGEVIAHFLRPGGLFYVRDFHPVGHMFDAEADTPVVTDTGLGSREPVRWENEGASYAVAEGVKAPFHYEWAYSLSEVINALIQAGLRIESVREYPFCTFRWHRFLEESDDGFWRWPGGRPVPLMFSIRATKKSP
ncbi:MAG TPA: class I SAM-dependent methyltransferase [Planctomycetota bacterium]|nr:class I SAM-dependent methyltransferase [Planctomycetota bacterium]